MGSGRIRVGYDELPTFNPSIPRPGDRVRWHENGVLYHGELIGHQADGSPRVRCTDTDADISRPNFDALTFEDPADRVGPNWTRLGPKAEIQRATEAEMAAFSKLLERPFVSGTSQFALFEEIRHHGHEAFVTGGTVRDVLAGARHPYDLDVVTTMPLVRLAEIGRGMFPSWPTLTEEILLNGRHTVGEAVDGVHLDIAVFKKAWPGTPSAIFGSDMTFDVRYRDFSINALFYDPLDGILYDPTGFGLADVDAAAGRRPLRIVGDLNLQNGRQQAKLCLRAVRFHVEGFVPEPATSLKIESLLAKGAIGAMPAVDRLAFLKSQLLVRMPADQRLDRIKEARRAFEAFGAAAEWDRFFGEEEGRLLS